MLLGKLNYLNSVKFESHLLVPVYQFFHNLGVKPCNLLIILPVTMFTRIFAAILKLLDEL